MYIPENDYEQRIVDTCFEISQLLLKRNRQYKNSYRLVRQRYRAIFNNPCIPFDLHVTEKRDRYLNSENDEEDSALDIAGLAVLEVVCRRLDN